MIKLELTKTEYDLLRKIKFETYSKLISMTKAERLEWFVHYPYPINFKKEINGTVYSVNSHFNSSANESIVEKAERIILKKQKQKLRFKVLK